MPSPFRESLFDVFFLFHYNTNRENFQKFFIFSEILLYFYLFRFTFYEFCRSF